MPHPMNIPDFQSALGALVPGDLPEGEGVAESISAAQMAASVVPACGLVLTTLKDHVADLGEGAANVLAGAAHLVLTNGWMQRQVEADGVRDAARARLAALAA